MLRIARRKSTSPDRGAVLSGLAAKAAQVKSCRLTAGPLPQGLLPRCFKGRDELAGLQFRRKQDHLFAGLSELVHVLVDNTPELRLQGCGLLALAVRRERDRTNDG